MRVPNLFNVMLLKHFEERSVRDFKAAFGRGGREDALEQLNIARKALMDANAQIQAAEAAKKERDDQTS